MCLEWFQHLCNVMKGLNCQKREVTLFPAWFAYYYSPRFRKKDHICSLFCLTSAFEENSTTPQTGGSLFLCFWSSLMIWLISDRCLYISAHGLYAQILTSWHHFISVSSDESEYEAAHVKGKGEANQNPHSICFDSGTETTYMSDKSLVFVMIWIIWTLTDGETKAVTDTTGKQNDF